MWTEQVRSMIGTGILETLYMTVVSTVFGYLFGLPMGILLCITDKEGLKTVAWKKLWFYRNDRPTDGSGDSVYRKNGRVFVEGSRLRSHRSSKGNGRKQQQNHLQGIAC